MELNLHHDTFIFENSGIIDHGSRLITKDPLSQISLFRKRRFFFWFNAEQVGFINYPNKRKIEVQIKKIRFTDNWKLKWKSHTNLNALQRCKLCHSWKYMAIVIVFFIARVNKTNDSRVLTLKVCSKLLPPPSLRSICLG